MEKNISKKTKYMDIGMEKRWCSYVYLEKDDVLTFAADYFAKRQSTLLFVMGCGFDPRMNNVLEKIISQDRFNQIECILIDFPSLESLPEDKLYKANKVKFDELCSKRNISVREVRDNHPKDIEKRIMGILKQLREIDYSEISDIIIDVSAMPRAIYFNVCKFFYKQCVDNTKNLFFTVSENVEIDKRIIDISGDEIHPMHGFGINNMLESNLDKRSVLIPLLGQNHAVELGKIYDNFKPVDVCPILPFPSMDPRRSEDILITHMDFFKRIEIAEPQNFTYADERNPFELYSIICDLVNNYKKTLMPITTCVCFGIAALTSKLMSLGALLCGLENSSEISFYTSSPVAYHVKDQASIMKINSKSDIFLMWITGEAYGK